MKAMVIKGITDLTKSGAPLEMTDLPDPEPGAKEILIKVSACGVCHTELDEIEGRTPPPSYPMIPGHQVVGHVVGSGAGATRFKTGDRVGVAWIFSACGKCKFCLRGLENLCPDFMATGRDAHGGYAEYMTVGEAFAYPIPGMFADIEAAPLLCAGAIGYRSLKLCELKDGQILGLSGFGASAHLVLKMAGHRYPNSPIFVLARSEKERIFAKDLGAAWAGDFGDRPPEKPDCVIDTTPAWKPVVESLKILANGGRLVINAIRKEEKDKTWLAQLDYPDHMWMEKEIKSVANVARSDVSEFLDLAARIPIRPETESFHLEDANRALMELKSRKIRGGKVLDLTSP